MAAAGAPVGMAVQCTGVTRLQHEVEFGVLGPLEVRVAGRPIAVPGVRQRALLTALLLRRGIVVTFDRLVDEVFGKEPPEEARNALQTYVARLRHALGPAAAVVVTRAPGYVLDVPGHAVDTERFTTLLGKARHMHSPTAALALLDEALALWRGPAYAEFAETFARGETLRLHELWLAAQEDRAALLLRLGRLAESTAALEAIVAQEPWRERAVELLVSALAQAGRTPHALAVYTRYRDRLRDELGLDPSLRLRRLEEQVLRGELPPVQPHHAKRQPRTLPARATSFVGREQELALVRKTLAGGRLATLVGPGGVGKTRLAQQAAAAQRSVWWVDLAPLRDQDAVPHALADALDLDVQPGTPVLDTLRAWQVALVGSWSSTTASTCSPPWQGSPRSYWGPAPRFGCWRPAASGSASRASRSWSSRHLRCPRRTPKRSAPPRSGCSATGPARPTLASRPTGKPSSGSATSAAPLTASRSPSSCSARPTVAAVTRATTPSAESSTGPSTCSRQRSSGCSCGCRCSPRRSTSPPPRRSWPTTTCPPAASPTWWPVWPTGPC